MTREEAIRRIKTWNLDSDDMEVLSAVIPELAENEDEKIRKQLIDEVKEQISNIPEPDCCDSDSLKRLTILESWLTYLEKQKEQKPADDEAKAIAYREYERGRESGLRDGQKYVLDNAESYGLCKPAEWSEDYREEDLRTRFAFYTYKNEEDDGVLYLSNVFVEEASRNKGFGTKILAAAEKVAETLGAIKIRLKVKQNSTANAWYRKHGYGYMTFEDGYDWLEKTLEYMKPAKSAEWSEEDEVNLGDIKCALYNYYGEERAEELYNMLKSLCPSKDCSSCAKNLEGYISGRIDAENKLLEKFGALVTPEDELRIKPRWKPSEEQIKALQMVKDSHCFMYQKDRVAIEKLLEQIKSL